MIVKTQQKAPENLIFISTIFTHGNRHITSKKRRQENLNGLSPNVLFNKFF